MFLLLGLLRKLIVDNTIEMMCDKTHDFSLVLKEGSDDPEHRPNLISLHCSHEES